jgi:hypothetical protein
MRAHSYLHCALACKVHSICHIQRSGNAADVAGARIGNVQVLLSDHSAADAAAAAVGRAATQQQSTHMLFVKSFL